AGEIDLSVASIIACAGVVTAVVLNQTQSVVLGVTAGIGLGAAIGLVNGFVIAKLKINSLITTLASMQIARGLGYIISNGQAVGITKEEFFDLGYQTVFGIP
ncbi:MAG TPA: L-arabinose ABC transporter permease AraH, partial [Pasteurellaceae bacterium]|nr:L-arabinose ABC transporter permease AraH [Pasteurellaceae bacterium]